MAMFDKDGKLIKPTEIGGFASPPVGSAFEKSVENVKETDAAGNVTNYVPYTPTPEVLQAARDSAAAVAVEPPPRWDDAAAGPSIAERNAGVRPPSLRDQIRQAKADADAQHQRNMDTLNATRTNSEAAKRNFEVGEQQKQAAGEAAYYQWRSKQDPHGADFEKAEAAHFATNPYGARGEGVRQTRTADIESRKTYAGIQAKGGANQFTSSVARDNFNRELNHSGDLAAAQAYGAATEKGETAVRALAAEGHLNPKDFEWSPANPDGSPGAAPTSTNSHFIQKGPHYGALDYDKILFTGNERKGKAAAAKLATATETAQSRAERAATEAKIAAGKLSSTGDHSPADLKIMAQVVKGVDPTATPGKEGGPPAPRLSNGEPNPKSDLYWNSLKALSAHLSKGGAPPAPVQVAAVSPKTTAPTVTQNGHVYVRQPDGSYK